MANGNGGNWWKSIAIQVGLVLIVVGFLYVQQIELMKAGERRQEQIYSLEREKADISDVKCLETKLNEMDKKLDKSLSNWERLLTEGK